MTIVATDAANGQNVEQTKQCIMTSRGLDILSKYHSRAATTNDEDIDKRASMGI